MEYLRRQRRRLVALAAAGAAGAAAAYYVYTRWNDNWWMQTEAEREEEAAGESLHQEVDRDLQHHFHNIQRVMDSTTLPGMLGEMEAHLNRKADADHLLQRLREGRDGIGFAATAAGQLATWEELKIMSFTRTLSATWLVPLVDLLLRVQLNMLGRHIFLENNLIEARPAAEAWPLQSGSPAHQHMRVSNRAQQMFLEYAHFIPERGTDLVVAHMRQAVLKVIGSADLKQRMDASQVMQSFSDVYTEFEASMSVLGWAAMLFPRDEEAEAYFARYHEAAPDFTALRAETSLQKDEEIVKALMKEARLIIHSSKFHNALKAAVQEAARQVITNVSEGLEQRPLGLHPQARFAAPSYHWLPVVQNTVDRDVEVGRCQVPVKQGVVVTHPDGGLDIAMMVIVDDKGKVMPSPAAAAASGQSHCCISAPGCHTALCAQPATRPALPTTCTPQVTPGGATGWGVPSPQQGLPQDLQPQCHQTEAQCPMSEAGKDQQVPRRLHLGRR
ncbi:hypothetical protein WJX72_008483 [[Myrmecia] bisecta]|uniref:Uncharacterized protein n=1 Tax=[Myrmecia] bisecta TaxID=41462 RepID=A0AAW1PUT6_9CHLO